MKHIQPKFHKTTTWARDRACFQLRTGVPSCCGSLRHSRVVDDLQTDRSRRDGFTGIIYSGSAIVTWTECATRSILWHRELKVVFRLNMATRPLRDCS